MAKVAVIMGSKSDYDVMKPAVEVLRDFGVEVVSRVISAHRTPDLTAEFSRSAVQDGFEAIIAGAGGAAALPGAVAALTTLPVIGVPVAGKNLGGLDSLLSMVQMPSGVPVATVAVGNAKNAALLAVRILSIKHADLRDKMGAFMEKQRDSILNEKL